LDKDDLYGDKHFSLSYRAQLSKYSMRKKKKFLRNMIFTFQSGKMIMKLKDLVCECTISKMQFLRYKQGFGNLDSYVKIVLAWVWF